jgi:alpha-galactosidase/6-phospho-beta-glucosidase family protein
VLEAMLADPMAGRLPYEHVVRMTDELLAATSRWLPQFAGDGKGA